MNPNLEFPEVKMSLSTSMPHPVAPPLPGLPGRHIRNLHATETIADAIHCTSCLLRGFCLPCGLAQEDIEKLDSLVSLRRTIRRGQALYHANDAFENIYAARTGSFKSLLFNRDGREQITSFRIAGELLGLDGISTDRHICDAVALEDSQVCVIPFRRLARLGQGFPTIQNKIHQLFGEEITREHKLLMMLGNMRAEERVATFILDLSDRLTARGYSSKEFTLRATRDEIGNYLGIKMETVSRAFSRLQESGLISLQQKLIRIVDVQGLRALSQ